ncbi:MAG: hypothetical protein AB1634_15145 [Thermodesulfobacteriota bacterium]
MKEDGTRDASAILRDGKAIDRAMVAAHRRIIIRHRQLKVPLVIWRDGMVVEECPDAVALPPGEDLTEPVDGER